jgi:hypothetical protein
MEVVFTLIRKLLLFIGVPILCLLVLVVVARTVTEVFLDPHYSKGWSDVVATACNRQYAVKGRWHALKKIKDNKEDLREVVRILSGNTTEDQYIIVNAGAWLSEIDPNYEDFIIPIIKGLLEEEYPPGNIPYSTFFSTLANRKSDKARDFIIEFMKSADKDLDHFLHKKRGMNKNWTVCDWIIQGLESATGQKIGHDHQKWIAWFEHH